MTQGDSALNATEAVGDWEARRRGRYERLVKPIMDWLFGLVLTILALPLMVLIEIKATQQLPIE